jgi:hypothetical protein
LPTLGGESDDDEGAGWREPAITFRVEVMFFIHVTLDESMMIATAAAINMSNKCEGND